MEAMSSVSLVCLVLVCTSINIIKADNTTKITAVDKKDGNERRTTDAKVFCKEKAIEIIIPISKVRSLNSKRVLSPSKVIFRADGSRQCQARRLNRDTYRIVAKLEKKECGWTVKNTKYQTEYTNEVILIDVEAGDTRSLVNVTCVYQDKNQLVILPLSSSETRFSLKNRPVMKVKMSLYRDKSYSYDSKIRDVTPEISVGHFVYVAVDFSPTTKELPSNFHIVAKSCYASYFSDYRNAQTKHDFIFDGCADDQTVAIQSNGEKGAVKWKYQMFKWVDTASQRIYLFCEVELCDSSDYENQNNCSTRNTKENCYGFTYRGKKRRETGGSTILVEKKNIKNIVAIGPIFPKESRSILDNSNKDKNEPPENNDATNKNTKIVPVVIGVIAGVCAIILIIVIYMFWRWKAARRSEEQEQNKKEIEQGFAFVMKSSKDPESFRQTSSQQEEPTSSQPSAKSSADNNDFHSDNESARNGESEEHSLEAEEINNREQRCARKKSNSLNHSNSDAGKTKNLKKTKAAS